jgi:DNA uptake protein ComE-like DNA-binding protein
MKYAVAKVTTLFACLCVGAPAVAQLGNNTAVLNPNTVEAAALKGLPHVTEPLSQAIVAGRPWLTTAAFNDAVAKALSEAQRAELYSRLFLQINLNQATRAEIMLIPGMSSRMAHEFEEYRPYTSLVQFRREMGKYVDAREVARLEQYVFVPMNLNTATEADFKTIPGMTNRMVHEFMEYRPYTSIEQFQREIGKYVDAKEVARLESYVALK